MWKSELILAKTEREMLDEHTKWIEILDLSGCDAILTQVFRRWDSVHRRKIVDMRGRVLYLSFDVETKDLLEYKAQKAGKKITFAKRDLQEYREKYNY